MKTIAFLQPKINSNEVSFVYINRLKLTMESTEHLDILWIYFKKSEFQKLDNYYLIIINFNYEKTITI